MKRYCLALDLKDDEALIKAYEQHHAHVPDAILESIKDAGIIAMKIYRTGNRMFMIMEVNDDFNFDKKSERDAANEAVQQWEQLMWNYQQALPWAKEGEKWVLMSPVFEWPKGDV